MEPPVPHSVAGWIYESDGVTQVPLGTSFRVLNVNTADSVMDVTNVPVPGQSGRYSVVIDAVDGDAGYTYAWNDTHWGRTDFAYAGDLDNIDVVLDQEFPNSPPELDPIGNREIDEEEPLSIQLSAVDPDDDTLTYGVVESLPSSFSFDTETGLFEWTPSLSDSGAYEVTFTVTDSELADDETITITVNDVVVDSDGDGVPDDIDICPGFDDNLDADSDGWPDSCDNCPDNFNPDQADADFDQIGDECDGCCLPPTVGDVDQSGGVDITDISVLIDNQFLTLTPLVCEEEGDIDFSGVVDITDLSILIDNQFLSLGPLPPCP